LQAEFENFRKRSVKQQTELLERAAENLVRELLPVLDIADLAQAHGADDQVGGALFDALRKEGLERLDQVGNPFDPTEHDAVMHEEGDGEPEVIEVMRNGYRWRGRLLRPAMVKVKGG
jgi:molecular chaperone GrpE